jgi:gluconate 5-dehydrogenase
MFKSGEEYQKVLIERIKSGSMGYRNLFDLTDKVAIVTGGAGGLGRPTSLGLADFGANVVVTDIKREALEKVKSEIEQLGRESLAITCDVTNPEDVKKMVKQTMDKFGRIDILVTYAGRNIPKPAEEYPYEDWKSVIDLNVTGVFLCNQEVGKVMIKQKRGKIVNVSSVRGRYGLKRNYIGYCTSKGAVDMITRTLACEWAKFNVLVNAIAPTVVETPLTAHILANPDFAKSMKDRIPLGRWGFPDDLIGAVIYFASDASNFITGQILYIDGGVTTW